jgi:DNA polymerase epsilon subunit 2
LPIRALRGVEGPKLVFGMLSQIKEGKLYLEDKEDHIELDLTEMNTSSGFFTETCFVLAYGVLMEGAIFKVKELAHPPSELLEINRSIYESINLFGGDWDLEDQVSKNLSPPFSLLSTELSLIHILFYLSFLI